MSTPLPALPELASPHPEALSLMRELRQSGFRGEVSTRAKDRLAAATDNSVYQCTPAAVVFPSETQDLLKLLRLAAKPDYSKVALTPRGAGTGTNGQSLTAGVVVDLSRHMNAILEINPQAGYAIVQPGVVLDQLNRALEPHGLRFAPDLSPSSRATLGGMIGTDASGKGSRVFGKTSQHIMELELALIDGTQFTSKEVPAHGREAFLESLPPRAQAIYQEVGAQVLEHQAEIRKRYPPLKRFVTGYNLPHIFPEGPEGPMNLNPLICGSEGSLAFVTQAKVKVVPQVIQKALWVLTYATFDEALSAAQDLVALGPGAIETVDDTILALARKDSIWDRVEPVLGAFPQDDVAAINLVELWANDKDQLAKKTRIFESTLRNNPAVARAAVKADKDEDAAALWDLRKKGVGLLGARPGERRPVAFVEDSVVPPERLADYIRDFRAILDREGLEYGMFGHVDVGCLHVRPALNLRLQEDRAAMKRISDEVQALAARYGGVLWGEHGRGYRSAYTPEFFGETIYRLFRTIKGVFDPNNQLNPGKIAIAKGHEGQLVSVDGLTRGQRDQKIARSSLEHYAPIVNCNGNAACMNVLPESLMCPSSKVTRDRVHSPKGRATMMREWLARLGEVGLDPAQTAAHRVPKQWQRWFRSPKRKDPTDDFSLEVWESMHGCLACKACTTQCPLNVDIPSVRAEFLSHFYSRYRRPLRDHMVGAMEKSAVWMTKAPRLSGWIMGGAAGRWLMNQAGGLVDLPSPSRHSVRSILRNLGLQTWDVDALIAQPDPTSVVLVQDPVTSFYDTEVFEATLRFIQSLGVEVRVLRFGEHGKGLHVKGMLQRFERVARIQASRLRALGQVGYTLVGIDPAYTLAYQDDYHQVLGPDARPPKVWMLQAWIRDQLQVRPRNKPAAPGARFTLFSHCTEASLSAQSHQQWREVFETLGFSLDRAAVGCCGMGGVFGHQREHLQESRGIFEQSWKIAWERAKAQGNTPLAPGYSCRSQCKRFLGERIAHPIELLAAKALGLGTIRSPIRGKSSPLSGAST